MTRTLGIGVAVAVGIDVGVAVAVGVAVGIAVGVELEQPIASKARINSHQVLNLPAVRAFLTAEEMV